MEAHAAGAVRGHAERGVASLYRQPWVWTNELGEAVTFSQWRGSPVVVTAIYTTCVRTCPQTVVDLRRLDEAFSRERRDAQFLLVTLDPTTDTPLRLREFKESRGLPDSWHLLSGSPMQTKALTDFLDVHVMNMDAHVFHEAKITIFDVQGLPTWSFDRGDLDGAAALHLPN